MYERVHCFESLNVPNVLSMYPAIPVYSSIENQILIQCVVTKFFIVYRTVRYDIVSVGFLIMLTHHFSMIYNHIPVQVTLAIHEASQH